MKGIRLYFLDEVSPRRRQIITGSEVWEAMAVAVGVSILVVSIPIKIGSIAQSLLTYAAIALGFSLAGFTVCLTLPDKDFAKRLVSSKVNDGQDAYSDLLFAFSWTALVHWVLIVVSLTLLVCNDATTAALRHEDYLGQRILVGLITFLAVYAFLNFLIVLLTLSQAGAVYIRHIKDPTVPPPPSDPPK